MTEWHEAWSWRDSRTGKRVSITSAPTRELAEMVLRRMHDRDRRGGRPDLHEMMPYIEVYRLGDDDYL